jgi:hypothetical protein
MDLAEVISMIGIKSKSCMYPRMLCNILQAKKGVGVNEKNNRYEVRGRRTVAGH